MTDTQLQQLKTLIEESRDQAQQALAGKLEGYDAIDLAEQLGDLPTRDKVRLFEALEPEIAANVLDETDRDSREQLLRASPDNRIARIVKKMPPDEAADILQQIPTRRAEYVLGSLSEDLSVVLEELITYDPDTAGGMMTTDFYWARETETMGQALSRIGAKKDVEHRSEIFVIDQIGRLRGILPINTLLEHPSDAPLGQSMNLNPHRVTLQADQEFAVNVVQKYNLSSLPVVDDGGILKGVITLDDVLDVFEEEVDEDIFRLAGTLSKDLERAPIHRNHLERFPFLLARNFTDPKLKFKPTGKFQPGTIRQYAGGTADQKLDPSISDTTPTGKFQFERSGSMPVGR